METTLLDKLDDVMKNIADNWYQPEYICLNSDTKSRLLEQSFNKYGTFEYFDLEFKIDDTIDAGVFYITFKF